MYKETLKVQLLVNNETLDEVVTVDLFDFINPDEEGFNALVDYIYDMTDTELTIDMATDVGVIDTTYGFFNHIDDVENFLALNFEELTQEEIKYFLEWRKCKGLTFQSFHKFKNSYMGVWATVEDFVRDTIEQDPTIQIPSFILDEVNMSALWLEHYSELFYHINVAQTLEEYDDPFACAMFAKEKLPPIPKA